jgi:hypothetical protein
MRALATKLISILIIYFAGFATAIYMLAPVPKSQARQSHKKGFVYSAFKSDEFAKSFNQSMHKYVDLGKNAAFDAGKFIKQKLNEK